MIRLGGQILLNWSPRETPVCPQSVPGVACACRSFALAAATHASLEDSKIHLRWVHRFLYDVYLDAIDRSLLDKIVQARRAEGLAIATVNRLLEIIRAVLRKAMGDWEWIDRIPAIRLQPNPVRRIRWLTREEADRLLRVLPPHQAALVRFSLATGLREKK